MMEGAEVGRDGVAIVEAVQHQPRTAPLLRDRQVPHPAQGGLDLPELGVEALAYGVPPDQPPVLPGPPEDVAFVHSGDVIPQGEMVGEVVRMIGLGLDANKPHSRRRRRVRSSW